MRSLAIAHNVDIDTSELELYFHVNTFSVNDEVHTVYNPYFQSTWGDFDWLRSLFDKKTDARCFATSSEKLRSAGITGHIGMYDLLDRDDVYDFYIGVGTKLDSRAKKNGFRTNEAWLCIHEYLHGREQGSGSPDRVHEMESQGRLKELFLEYETKDDISILRQLVLIWRKLKALTF